VKRLLCRTVGTTELAKLRCGIFQEYAKVKSRNEPIAWSAQECIFNSTHSTAFSPLLKRIKA